MKRFLFFTTLALPLTAAIASSEIQQNNPHLNNTNDTCQQLAIDNEARDSVLNALSQKVHFSNEPLKKNSLQQRMKNLNVSAVSIATIKNNTLDWSASVGTLNTDSNDIVDCNTAFQAASLSKPITMLSMLRMAEKDVIDLDKNIQYYLTNYNLSKGKQTEENPVTFRNLLNHTSGITPGGYLGYSEGQSIPSNLAILNGEKPSNTQAIEVLSTPGEKLQYSGGGYTLAETALQDKFKLPFEDIMQQWLFDPLDISIANFSMTHLPTKIAHGHKADGNMVAGGWHRHPEQAAAGLWSNANDLARVLIEVGKGYRGQSEFFSKQLIDQLLNQRINDHFYGFVAYGENEQLTIAHYGGNVGYRAAMVLHLESGNGMVILTNSDNGSALASDLLRAASAYYQWPFFKPTKLTKKSVAPNKLKRLAGQYQFAQQGWQIDIKYDAVDNEIAIIFPNNDKYSLVSTTQGDTHFVHPETGVEAAFSIQEDSTTIKLYGQTGAKL